MPNVLITGAGRRAGVAAACAMKLANSGWDVGLSYWRQYDVESGLAGGDNEQLDLVAELRAIGGRIESVEVDLGDPEAPAQLFEELQTRLGSFDALVASHCRDVELSFLGTSAEEFDRHFAVNARSVALLIQEFARRLSKNDGRVVAFTSDALAGNVPYGVSKGALDRIVRAAALELGRRGIRANCINPGPTGIPSAIRFAVNRRAKCARTWRRSSSPRRSTARTASCIPWVMASLAFAMARL